LSKLSAQESHGAPPGVYLLLFWITFWPGAPLAGMAAPAVWRARREPAVQFLLAWLVPSWIVFELVLTKLMNMRHVREYPGLPSERKMWVRVNGGAGAKAGAADAAVDDNAGVRGFTGDPDTVGSAGSGFRGAVPQARAGSGEGEGAEGEAEVNECRWKSASRSEIFNER